ncbi:MAG TPA: ABC transporter ATP-binding protein [Candidatus Dormibacteraeota bacterium]|nr:ABC transporter ATP-binding protein [Candidatus Dormibacteraeota bacterium]
MDLLEFQSVTAGYNDIPVTREISLSVSKAEIVALLGPNGAGKSTLLKALMSEARVFSGSVLLRGDDVTGLSPERLAKKGLGYVPQNENVFPSLTVLENLEMGAFLAPRRRVREKIEAILGQFPPLRPLIRRKVNQLSGGERRLVAIGRALVLSPEVLLLDEPTANLSPGNARSVLTEYVTRVAEAGTGVLLVEQRAKEALQIAHHACVMSAGRIEVSGSPSALLERADIGRLFLGETTRRPG